MEKMTRKPRKKSTYRYLVFPFYRGGEGGAELPTSFDYFFTNSATIAHKKAKTLAVNGAHTVNIYESVALFSAKDEFAELQQKRKKGR